MQKDLEQRYAFKFCVKFRKTTKGSKDMLQQAYGDSLMSMSMFYQRYNASQSGQESIVDEPWEG